MLINFNSHKIEPLSLASPVGGRGVVIPPDDLRLGVVDGAVFSQISGAVHVAVRSDPLVLGAARLVIPSDEWLGRLHDRVQSGCERLRRRVQFSEIRRVVIGDVHVPQPAAEEAAT